MQSFYTTGTQKKFDAKKVDGFCGHCNTLFGAMGPYYHYCPCQEARFFVTEDGIQRSIKKNELEKLRKQYEQEKGFNVFEMNECDWWKMYKTNNIVKQHLRESFHNKMHLREEKLLRKIKSRSLFGYVQCDYEVPENLRETFANFPTT